MAHEFSKSEFVNLEKILKISLKTSRLSILNYNSDKRVLSDCKKDKFFRDILFFQNGIKNFKIDRTQKIWGGLIITIIMVHFRI